MKVNRRTFVEGNNNNNQDIEKWKKAYPRAVSGLYKKRN
jgi:hypothetical protein